LHSENLIEDQFEFGPQDYMKKHLASVTDGGIVCQPSAHGAELFLWAFGESDKDMNYLFHPEFKIEVEKMPSFIVGACPTKAPVTAEERRVGLPKSPG
jgi:hypothetical protein